MRWSGCGVDAVWMRCGCGVDAVWIRCGCVVDAVLMQSGCGPDVVRMWSGCGLRVSYLISLNPLLFKNITHVGSLMYFVFVFVCVFVISK